MPFFLPIIANIIARGGAVIGRLGAAAGRMASTVGSKIGGAARAGSQRAAGAFRSVGQAARGTASGGAGFRGAAQPGQPAGGRRRPVTPSNQAGGKRSKQFKNNSFSQAWRQSVRRGMRSTTQKNRSGGGSQFIQKLFDSKSFLGRITQNFGSAKANFKAGNNFDGVMDSLKVAKDGTKPIAAILAGLGAAAITMVTLPKIVKDWGASLVESKKELGEFNASFSVALGRLDIARFGRNIRLANATSGSFRSLTGAQNRLEERLLPLQIMSTNAILKIADEVINGVVLLTYIAEGAAKVTGWSTIINALAQKFNLFGNGAAGQTQPLADLGKALANGNFVQRRRPPMPPLNNARPRARFGRT